MARRIATRASLNVVAAAIPPAMRSLPDAGLVGEAFPAIELAADLRQAIASPDLDLALLLTPDASEPGAAPDAGPLDDPDLIRTVRAAGLTLVSTEPEPGSTLGAKRLDDAGLVAPFRIVPLLTRTPVFADASDALESFGAVRTIAFAARASAAAGSLGARLFDAMQAIHALFGVPDSIDAAYVPHDNPTATTASPPPIRRLHGDMTANLRFAPGQAASVTVSSRAGRWFRGLTLLSERGCIRIDESGFERFDPDGALVDSSEPRPLEDDLAIDTIADAVARTIDPRRPDPPPLDLPPVLAMCEAAVLSAHTGQAEPPAAILQMARSG